MTRVRKNLKNPITKSLAVRVAHPTQTKRLAQKNQRSFRRRNHVKISPRKLSLLRHLRQDQPKVADHATQLKPRMIYLLQTKFPRPMKAKEMASPLLHLLTVALAHRKLHLGRAQKSQRKIVLRINFPSLPTQASLPKILPNFHRFNPKRKVISLQLNQNTIMRSLLLKQKAATTTLRLNQKTRPHRPPSQPVRQKTPSHRYQHRASQLVRQKIPSHRYQHRASQKGNLRLDLNTWTFQVQKRQVWLFCLSGLCV